MSPCRSNPLVPAERLDVADRPEPPSTAEQVHRAPAKGRMIWVGYLAAKSNLVITGDSVSAGSLSGALPGKPVGIRAYPAGRSRKGIRVLHGRRSGGIVVKETQSALNNWSELVLTAGPRRLSAVVIDCEVPPNSP